MKTKFLKYLVCIACKRSLKLKALKKNGEEIIEGRLSCSCGKHYSIRNGIPRMLPSALAKDKKATASAFGKKWHEFGEMHKHHESQFLDWIWPVTKSFFRRKLVFDAGCGQGRHVFFAAKYGAKAVFGVDLSEAVELAYKNTKKFSNVCIIQGDIYNLPFKEKTFDYAFSIGVLHHLPDPERGFDSVLRMVKPKGTFSSWVYGKQGPTVKIFNTVRKILLSHLPLSINYLISWLTTLVVYPSIKIIYEPLHAFSITKPLAKLLPQSDFMRYLGSLGFRMTHEIIYDQFIAPTAFYYSDKEFKRWFRKPEIKSFTVTERNRNSWRGTATRR